MDIDSLATIRLSVDNEVSRRLNGKPVSCRAGCSACCHQIVYMSLAEAWDIVEKHYVAIAGMRATLTEISQRLLSNADNFAYFGTPCPLLKNDRCSIYAERPIVCRTHNVASPPERCQDARDTVMRYDLRDLEARAAAAVMHASAQPHSLLPIPVALLLCLDAQSSIRAATAANVWDLVAAAQGDQL